VTCEDGLTSREAPFVGGSGWCPPPFYHGRSLFYTGNHAGTLAARCGRPLNPCEIEVQSCSRAIWAGVCRVGGACRQAPPPSEPDVRVSPHPAQAVTRNIRRGRFLTIFRCCRQFSLVPREGWRERYRDGLHRGLRLHCSPPSRNLLRPLFLHDQRDVSPLSGGSEDPIRPMTGRRSLLPASSSRSACGHPLQDAFSFMESRSGLPRSNP
jgi:hypothetical protein